VTAQRREEVTALPWRELTLDGAEASWTIPAARAKNGREQFVPLSELAVDILKSLPRIAGKLGYVFTTTGDAPVSGWSRATLTLQREILRIAREETGRADLEIPHWTLHDLRRTAATGMQRLGMPIEVVEAVLNHKAGKVRGVAAIYGKHNFKAEKAQALAAWSRALEALVNGKVGGNVVKLARAS
jgi:integrase